MSQNINQKLWVKKIKGFDIFIDELKSHCYSNAIATVNSARGTVAYDLMRQPDNLVLFDGNVIHEEVIKSHILNAICDSHQVVIILRSFREEEIHPESHLPMKDIRAYIVKVVDDTISFVRVSPEDIRESFSYDNKTGMPCEIEKELNFV